MFSSLIHACIPAQLGLTVVPPPDGGRLFVDLSRILQLWTLRRAATVSCRQLLRDTSWPHSFLTPCFHIPSVWPVEAVGCPPSRPLSAPRRDVSRHVVARLLRRPPAGSRRCPGAVERKKKGAIERQRQEPETRCRQPWRRCRRAHRHQLDPGSRHRIRCD